ncbi:MAG TPA: EF-hand domain-containing protein [Gemmataceae bacterium]|jgi:Ca2+-binding EF-hand superfamily protein|nr:EF-hand domain-containing protein [Gemmataceae bacterium]
MRKFYLSAFAVTLCSVSFAFGQVAIEIKPMKADELRKPPLDEYKALLSLVSDAYKAPREVEKDVLDELRKQYEDPQPKRESKILSEVRRLYVTSPAIEENIVRELRQAYQSPSAEQEERVLSAIRQGGVHPVGTIAPEVQAEQAQKLFRKLDQNRDGFLDRDEVPAFLLEQFGKWDANRDGKLDATEYAAYHQAQVKWVADGVATGEIPLKAAQAAGVRLAEAEQPLPARPLPERPAATKAKLPDWFYKFDLDQDGQIGLYEWKKMGRPTAEFLEMDLNNDGFVTADELTTYLASHPTAATTGK